MSLKLQTLNSFNQTTLEEIDKVKLLDRVDTKFVFKVNQLDELLNGLKENYDVLNVKNELAVAYESLYFDSKNYFTFNQHHREKGERFKIRFRNYVSSKLCFLEVKKKHKGRTIKKRIKVDNIEHELSPKNKLFISKHININDLDLKSSIQINYNRITLVNKDKSERITLDTNLTFIKHNAKKVLDQIIIAELKQEKLNRTSKFYRAVKKLHIRNLRVSKYCTGIILTTKNIKYNLFKEKIRYIDKLNNGYISANITA